MPQRNWTDDPPGDWGEREAYRIAQEVRRVRTESATSAQQLSDKTAEAGMPVSRAVIADFENGRRRYVTTAELIALSWALEIHPIDLLYPIVGESAEFHPGAVVSRTEAVQSFTGLYDEEKMDRLLTKSAKLRETIRTAVALFEEISAEVTASEIEDRDGG